MLKIKLARFGKRNQPHYRIVVNEARSKRDGSYVEMLGHYAPAQQPKLFELNLERYDYWLSQGAQPTKTVAVLAEKLRAGEPISSPKKKSQKKKKEQEKKKKQAVAEVKKKSQPKNKKQIESAQHKADQDKQSDDKKQKKEKTGKKGSKKKSDKKTGEDKED